IDNPKVFDCPSDGLAADGDTTPDYLTDGYMVACLTDRVVGLKSDGKTFVHDYPKEVLWRHNVPANVAVSDVLPEPMAATGPEISPEPTTPPEPPEPPKPPAGLTSLGSTLQEITGSMMALIQEFFDKNGEYPRSWGDYAYTDIGLDPGEWEKAYDGIIYTPVGNSIKVTPGDGYVFYVTGLDGKEKTVKSSFNWSLWYSMENGTWYYHKIADKNEIDISTLRVETTNKK
ncbi:MAG: hypothetical protein JW765_00335, partial [Deltaproteobacteria bacterium]|nr:hypothetical protein [Candidatus Zymogenaceae bacterium]